MRPAVPARLDAPVILEVPVVPDGPTAQEWAQEELSKAVYHPQQNPITRFITWLGDWLDSILQNINAAGIPVPVFWLLVASVLALALWLFVGVPIRRRTAARAGRGAMFAETVLTAADYHAQAAAARAAGDLDTAFLATFRALVAAMSERAVIDAAPGMTAREATVAIAGAFPAARSELTWAAEVFDAVAYADAHVTARDDEALVALTERLARQREHVPA